MDVEQSDNAVLPSYVTPNSTVSQQNEIFSSEDLAWVDSCLNNDFDISESDWMPMRNALLEIISSESQPFKVDGGDGNQSIPYSEESNTTFQLNQSSSTSDVEHLQSRSSTYNVSLISMATETSIDTEFTNTLSSSIFQGNPFLPTYNEDLRPNKTFDLGLDLDSETYEMDEASENIFKFWDMGYATDESEQASESIFKVWDLDIPSEEGELVKELKKALSKNSLRKDMKEESLDDLIAGIADLSLNKKV